MRRIISILPVLMIMVALFVMVVTPAFADSTRVCNNRCGDVDLSTDNSQDNDVTTNNDNDVTTNNDNDVTTNNDNDVTTNNDNDVTNDQDVTSNNTTKTCGTISGNNSSCNIS